MSHAHHHADHHHGHQKLDAAFVLTLGFAVVELGGGWIADSLALLADAAHMGSDVVALALALFAARLANRPAHNGMTYGYGRARVLAAQANGFGLWFLSGWIVWEAIGRMQSPPQVSGGLVVAVAAIGLLVNLIILKWLHGAEELNTRAAYWHVVGDALGSVAAIVTGIVIIATGWMLIDPILSFLVAGILLWGGWRLVREATGQLMESVPTHVDVERITAKITELDGVCGIHHLHFWTLPDGRVAMSAHLEIASIGDWDTMLVLLLTRLHALGIDHATLQPESAHLSGNCQVCDGNGC